MRRRLRTGLLLLLAASLVALAGHLLLRHRAAPKLTPAAFGITDPAPLTPGSPAVDRLRQAVKGGNIIICVLDAARADHFGSSGYPRDTTPNADTLASQGWLFENHFAQVPETGPSTASLFTSQYPDTHLAYGNRSLAGGTFTLAQGLASAGYHTVLFSQNARASPMWGMAAGFRESYHEPHLKAAGRDVPMIWRPEALLEQITPWLSKKPPTPFFAYIHFMPPHSPYIAPFDIFGYYMGKTPPNAWRGDYPFPDVEHDVRAVGKPWDQQMDLNRYDGNLRYADWAVGQLVQALSDAKLFDNTLLIITTDHGEAAGEHGYKGHGTSVFDETIHIPLVMRLPRSYGAGKRIHGLTETIDLLPTIFDLCQIPYPRKGVQGRSLLPLMAGEENEVRDYIFARALGQPPSYAVRNHDWAVILYQGGKLRALYDLKDDPRQLKNLIASHPQQASQLIAAFRTFASQQTAPPLDFVDPKAAPPRLPKVPEIKPTEEMMRSLRALGYVK